MTDQAPVIEIAEAVANTIANPLNPEILVEDVILAHKLATALKAALAGKHPNLSDLVHYLFMLSNNE
jgi:hypothetical protein